MTIEAVQWYQTDTIIMGMIVIGLLWLLLDRLLFVPLERATVARWDAPALDHESVPDTSRKPSASGLAGRRRRGSTASRAVGRAHSDSVRP